MAKEKTSIENRLERCIERVKSIGEDCADFIIASGVAAGTILVVLAASGAVALAAGTLVNKVVNNKEFIKPGYHLLLKSGSLFGHTEYIEYANHSIEITKYSALFGPIKTSQDLNGDGIVDRIEERERFSNRLKNAFLRQQDYPENNTRFDEADRELKSLSDSLLIR